MSVKKYKFISPGVFINEIDNSALPATPSRIGPLVIGQTRRGPAMKPVRVSSFSEFIDVFGTPVPGTAPDDAWRNGAGIETSPSYAAYAAQAWLENNGPITVVRLLGEQHTDATTGGYAGWQTPTETSTGQTNQTQGGAYGLFLIASSSGDEAIGQRTGSAVQTGSLAAIFYTNTGCSIRLSGNIRDAAVTAPTASAAELIGSSGANHRFTLEVVTGSGAGTAEKFTFNFDENSPSYIRKVFNTNPSATNTDINSAAKSHWLGETFDQFITSQVGAGSATAKSTYGLVLQLSNGAISYGNRRHGHQAAQSGWVISQHLGNADTYNASQMPKLFKFHTRKAGEYEMHNLKISVEDIKPAKNDKNPYPTFTISLRLVSDTDAKIREVERYSGLNLNPASSNYIGRRIGTKFIDFDHTERRNKEYGKYENVSSFIRVEMDADLDENGPEDPSLVPFGFFGPPRFKGFAILGSSGSLAAPNGEFFDFGTSAPSAGAIYTNASTTDLPIRGLGDAVYHQTGTAGEVAVSAHNFTGSFRFPTIALRVSSSEDGLPSSAKAYHGFRTTRTAASSIYDNSVVDLLRPFPDSDLNGTNPKIFSDYANLPANMEIPVIFSLDEVHSASSGVSGYSNSVHAYSSGSRARGHSITADTTGYTKGSVTKTGWEAAVLFGADSFTMPLFGGFSGLDITEKAPFGNHVLSSNTAAEQNYAYNTVKQAMDLVADAEDVEYNIVSAPGVNEPTLTQHLVDIAEDRGDALALIDIEGDYTPSAESTSNFKNRIGEVDNAVKKMKDRVVDSSFAAAYYPYVQIVDRINNNLVFVPPSVVALGVLSNSEAREKLWFAPAGFNRGGLSQGAAGVPVIGITQKLSKTERDNLYDANINPIASFPSEGIVVFGQKTLQANASALDRINVRRLLIFLKKEISRIANSVLFDQNAKVTWNRFTGQVEPFLRGVQTGLGLEDFKIVLDETTTTPDLVDRNVLYAKIFLKPTKAIEYIAIDFNITNQGAAFDD